MSDDGHTVSNETELREGVGQRYPTPNTTGKLGTSAAKPACRNQPNLTSESVRFSCLDNLLSRQKSLANVAGTADPKPHRLAAAHEEHIKVMHCMPQEELGTHEQVHACRNTL
jgi:hypothetical protein